MRLSVMSARFRSKAAGRRSQPTYRPVRQRKPEEKLTVCGIAGIVRWDGRSVVEDEIRAMCRMMVHRGPDEEGVYLGQGAALGMRRLSIIDLENGHQPVSNEDGSIWVVFNG